MKKKIITILSTSVILSTFISALTLNANTELSSQNSCKDFQKFILTKGYDYNYKYDLNTNGTINVLDLCRQKKYELIKNNITTTTTTPVTTTTTKHQTTTTVVTTTAPPVTTTVQTTPVDTSSWGLSLEDIQGACDLFNLYRKNKNMKPLKVNFSMCAAANKRAKELEVSFSDIRPNGTSNETIFFEYGIIEYLPSELRLKGKTNYKDAVNYFYNEIVYRDNFIYEERYFEFGIGYSATKKTWAILLN